MLQDPNDWGILLSVELAAQWVFIIAGSIFILWNVALLVSTTVVGVGVRSLLNTTRRLLSDEVTPVVDSVGKTAKQVQGTTSFISETAVLPIIRIYGVIAGTRRFIAVITGISGRSNTSARR